MVPTDRTSSASHAPSDAIVERLNDPGVAAAMVTLLDNAELLSTLVLGLSGMIERSDFIMDSVVEGIDDLRQVAGSDGGKKLPSRDEVVAAVQQVSNAAPTIQRLLDSSIVRPEAVDLVSMVGDSAIEGAEIARANNSKVTGVFDLMKSLKDEEVQKGLGFVIEVAKAVGRNMDSMNPGA